MRFAHVLAAVLPLVLSTAFGAEAVDRPVSGQRLAMKRLGQKGKITFVTNDPAFPFPAIGGPDDPSVVGATIEFLPTTVGARSLPIPAGLGKRGWTPKPGAVARYKYARRKPYPPATVVMSAVLMQGKQMKITITGGLVDMPGGIGPIAVRVTTGSLRTCALFTAESIDRDEAGIFSAAHAPAPAIADCSDASLGVPCAVGPAPACGGACAGDGVCTPISGGCRCVSPSAPCGDTYPTCNGICPGGDVCLVAGGKCSCAAPGSLGCQETGPPTCGGVCASGEVCRPMFGPFAPGGVESFWCGCAPPLPCSTEVGLDCPPGRGCGVIIGSAGQAGCAAMTCDGTYPTCGGACGDGGQCQPVETAVGGRCICAVPAPCDAGCGGYSCPAGEVCAADTCGCVTP